MSAVKTWLKAWLATLIDLLFFYLGALLVAYVFGQKITPAVFALTLSIVILHSLHFEKLRANG